MASDAADARFCMGSVLGTFRFDYCFTNTRPLTRAAPQDRATPLQATGAAFTGVLR
jgi:hypothetical protein